MNVTYWDVLTHLSMWFMSRWGDLIASPENKFFYINLSLQDIYNEDSATFTWVTEELEWVKNPSWKYIFTTQFPIRKIQKIFAENGTELRPTLLSWDDCDKVKFEWKQIISPQYDKIKVTYIKDYEWANYPQDLVKPIPLPNRYLPVLYKLAPDWAWPINLMASESATYDSFWHAMVRLNKLVEQDWLTDYIQVNPAY